MFSELEQEVLRYVQTSLDVTPRPYRRLAERLGVTEEEIVACLRGLVGRGIIRRFGITIRHQISGVAANAMGAWKVPVDDVDKVGPIMASFPEVTHCYERRVEGDWPFNVFTMIHGNTPEDCQAVAAAIAEKTGIKEYRLLFSARELKKTSMRYL